MIKNCLLFLLFTTTTSLSNAQDQTDILHYTFRLQLNDKNDSIFGTTTIRFIAPKQTQSISLDLQNINTSGKGMMVTRINDDSNSKEQIPFTHQNNKLVLNLTDYKRTNDTLQLNIFYKGIPADGLIISKNKYGNRTFFSDNWPDRAHYWLPCNDRPDDKASFEFLVTAPDHYQVISNGVLVEESNLKNNLKLTHWKEEISLPTKIMVIGVASFAVNYIGNVNDCIPVSSWVFPENKEAGFYDYAMAKDILNFYINYIGPYPYKKLANVQSKTIFGGMENAGAIFYHENSVVGHREEESLFAHEIVHQWFGDMASEQNFSHLWLSEGFATYLTHIYYETKYGTDEFRTRLITDRNEVIAYLKYADKPIVDSITPRRQLINTNNYARAGWVLHMMRNKVGDSAFHSIIRSYYESYKGKNAYTKDFQKVAEKISGQSLDSFFDQWLYSPDIPKLAINWKYNDNSKQILLTVTQKQQSAAFQFPLEIAWSSGNMPNTIQKLEISKKEETFTISAPAKPAQLIVDPYTKLLFEGTLTETK